MIGNESFLKWNARPVNQRCSVKIKLYYDHVWLFFTKLIIDLHWHRVVFNVSPHIMSARDFSTILSGNRMHKFRRIRVEKVDKIISSKYVSFSQSQNLQNPMSTETISRARKTALFAQTDRADTRDSR